MPSASSPRAATRDPFLLPLCAACGGAMNLSSLEPHPTLADHEIKTFSCTRCGANEAFDVRKRVVRAVADD
jgi:hypothetical protein